MSGVRDIRAPLRPSGSESGGVTTVEVDENTLKSIPLSEISSGSKEILVLITHILMAKGNCSVLFVEEPELHLHPAAEQRIFELIQDTVSNADGPQVFISTHSDTFVDQSGVNNIFSVKRDPYTAVTSVEGAQLDEDLISLGYDKSDFVQSEKVIFVEGRSDKVIFERFADTLNYPFDRMGAELIVVDGDQVKVETEPVADVLDQLRIPYIYLFDSDDNDPEVKTESLANELGVAPSTIHVLDRYSIESYLTAAPAAIARVLNEEQEEISEFIDDRNTEGNHKGLLNDLYNTFAGFSYHAEKNGATIAKQMRPSEIDDEIVDFLKQIPNMD
jgi:predicted ATP-dependent endonuclease of OLD family